MREEEEEERQKGEMWVRREEEGAGEVDKEQVGHQVTKKGWLGGLKRGPEELQRKKEMQMRNMEVSNLRVKRGAIRPRPKARERKLGLGRHPEPRESGPVCGDPSRLFDRLKL